MNLSKKKAWLIGVVAVIVIAAAVAYAATGQLRLRRALSGNQEWQATYDSALQYRHKRQADPSNPENYLIEAQEWKTLGDLTRDQRFYRQAKPVYAEGVEQFGDKNILFYLNGGKLAELMAEYALAEKYYRRVIEILPHDENGYLYLTELYIYYYPQPKETILGLYNEAAGKILNPQGILSARASYLRRVGDLAAALQDYEELARLFPERPEYGALVQELRRQLKPGK